MLKQIDPNFVFYIITEPMEEEETAPAKAETPAKAPVASPKKEVASPKKEVASPKKEVTKEGETPKAEDATKEGETPKGQLISKFPYEKPVSSKYQRKYFWISALKFFVAFWGLPGSFLGFQ